MNLVCFILEPVVLTASLSMEVNDAPNVRPDITFLLNRNKESFRVCRVIRHEIRPVCHRKTPVSDMTKKRDVSRLTAGNVPHVKKGGCLLSRIALQYHRR